MCKHMKYHDIIKKIFTYNIINNTSINIYSLKQVRERKLFLLFQIYKVADIKVKTVNRSA